MKETSRAVDKKLLDNNKTIGLLNNGRAITVAKNIAVATSYPAQPVINVRSTESGIGYPTYPQN